MLITPLANVNYWATSRTRAGDWAAIKATRVYAYKLVIPAYNFDTNDTVRKEKTSTYFRLNVEVYLCD